MERFGIKLLVRYRDDILVVARDYDLFHSYFAGMLKCIDGARTACIEQESQSAVQMLDLTVYKRSHHFPCALGYKPHFKPSSKQVPLSMSSCHHMMVHSWPKAGLIRLARNSDTAHKFEQAKLEYILKLMRNHLEMRRLLEVMMFNPFQQKLVRARVAKSVLQDLAPLEKEIVVPLILDYHPFWQFVKVQSAVNSLFSRLRLTTILIWGCPVNMHIAYRNAIAPLALIFRRHAGKHVNG